MTSLDKLRSIKTPFTTRAAARVGVSARMLSYLTRTGEVARIGHGLYSLPSALSIDFKDLVREKLAQVPRGVIGLKSALQLHNLTDESPGPIDIIVPDGHMPKRRLEDVALIRAKRFPRRRDIETKSGIKVTGVERTIVDLLRRGESIGALAKVVTAAKAKRIEVRVGELLRLGRELQAKGRVTALIEAIM